MICKFNTPFTLVYVNSLSAYVPELWANESLAILEEEMVMGNLVHRDFNPEVASYGEIIHTRKPAEFVARRKGSNEAVTTQDASATDVEVRLDQWIHVSFVIDDGEMTKAFKDLVATYLHPAMLANARMLDQSLCGQAVQFLGHQEGGLGMLSSSTAKDYLIDTRDHLNRNKAHNTGRNLVLSSGSESNILKAELFHAADKLGDGGRALREASLGRKFGFNTFMDLNMPGTASATGATGTTTSASSLAGAASVAITAARAVGQYVTIAGDMTPLRSTTATTTFTPTRAIKRATTSGATVTTYATGAVDLVAGYASGYYKPIHVDGTGVPRVGQIVAFNAGDGATGTLRTPEYTIIAVDSISGDYEITLDRPLETALADGDLVCYGPNGDMNLAFHRNAIALVNRPLALPMSGTGARTAVATYNNMSMRVCMSYDPVNQGHRVTLDGLFGVKVLEPLLGCVLLG